MQIAMGDSPRSGRRVSFRLLGNVNLVAEGDRAVSDLLARPKLVGILAYLAVVATNSFVRRERLLALFWPENDEEHARASLRTALHRIRQSTDQDIFRTRGTEEIGIDPDRLCCDATKFEQLTASRNWQEADALYCGDFMDAFHADASAEFDVWLEKKRSAIREQAAQGAARLAMAEMDAGNFSAAADWSRRELEIVPTDESAFMRLLQALASAGESAAAIRAYDDFLPGYRDDVGADLSRPAQDLVERIRRGEFASSGSLRVTPTQSSGPVIVRPDSPSTPSLRRLSGFPRNPRIMLAAIIVLAGIVLIDRAHTEGGERTAFWMRARVTSQPLPRAASSFVYDPQSRQGLMFGGRTDQTVVSDVWRMKLSNDARSATWTRIETESPSPVGRWLHLGAYDSRRDQLIVVAGSAGYTSPCLSDVWVLDHAMRGEPPLQWRKIRVEGESPPARAEFGGVYDPKTRRMVIQGGHDCIAPVFDDIWVLSDLDNPQGAKWTRLQPEKPNGGPPPLRSQVMAYDPDHNRAIVFGGMDGRFPYGAVGVKDVWILSNANGLGGKPTWIKPASEDSFPPPTSRANGVFDPATNRLIVFGGYHGSGSKSQMTSDVWVLEGANGLAASARWRRVIAAGENPPPRIGAGTAFDPNTERLIMVGGQVEGKSLGDVWVLSQATGSR